LDRMVHSTPRTTASLRRRPPVLAIVLPGEPLLVNTLRKDIVQKDEVPSIAALAARSLVSSTPTCVVRKVVLRPRAQSPSAELAAHNRDHRQAIAWRN
jgi:hypothetical protein